jgi:hypothetical protein
MIILLMVFVALCVGTGMLQRVEIVKQLGLRLNVVLIGISLGLFALWYGLNAYSPALTIPEHWRMVSISLVGFLCMLLSTVTALRGLRGVRAGVFAMVSIGIGLLHFLDLVVSMPVS